MKSNFVARSASRINSARSPDATTTAMTSMPPASTSALLNNNCLLARAVLVQAVEQVKDEYRAEKGTDDGASKCSTTILVVGARVLSSTNGLYCLSDC